MPALGAIGTNGRGWDTIGSEASNTSTNGYIAYTQTLNIKEWVAGKLWNVDQKAWVSPNYNPDQAAPVSPPAQFLGGAFVSG